MESSRKMLPPKSRGQLLVSLANSSLNNNSSQPDNPDRSPDIADEQNDHTNTDVTLTYIELPYTSACSDLFNSISPIIEVIDNSNVNFAPESSDVDIIPINCLDSIDILFSSIDEEKLKCVTIEQNNNGDKQIEIDFNKESISNASVAKNLPNDILINESYENTDTMNKEKVSESYISICIDKNQQAIDEEQIEVSADILNSVDQNRINIEDPDYIANTKDDDTDELTSKNNGRPKKGRKRKYKDQNSSIRKKKANTNQDYFSAKGKKMCAKEFNISDCKCPLKCTEKISIEQRKKEFDKFWTSGSYETRCAILQGSVTETKTKRSYVSNSKRTFSRKYKLCNTSVCKKAFLISLSISQSIIDVALNKYREQASINDKRGVKSGGKNAISEEQLQQIKSFIQSLPKYSSHYCKDNTSAIFLAPNLNLTIIYDLYKEKYENPVSFSRFRLCFYKDFNLRFKKPQKDTCLRCDLYKANKSAATGEQLSLLENEHKDHLNHAYKLRDQMKKDLAAAKINDSLETLTFDLEKTHCLPRLPKSIVYYKRQLNLHNLGIHYGSNGKGYFHIWLEHEAGRGTQEVGSCLKKIISEHLKPGVSELILWADSCGGQNRSIKMVLMILHILHGHPTIKKITMRFLQPGHTYLPNDSEFGDVECALKSQIRLYTPEDYISVMENCRRKNKFVVTRVQQQDFKSITPLLNSITNRKSDLDKKKISWLSTFEIEVRRDEPLKLFMKSNLEEEAQVIDISKGGKGRKQKPNFAIDLPILYPNGRELSTAKVQDLKELLKLIPTDAKTFYSFLRNVSSHDFVDDADGLGNTIDYDIEENVIED